LNDDVFDLQFLTYRDACTFAVHSVLKKQYRLSARERIIAMHAVKS